MSLIEGIGDEVTHFFLAVLIIVLVSIAWWSTNITDQRQLRTVVLLDRRRRRPILRRLPLRRAISQTEIQGVSLPSAVHVVVTEDEAAASAPNSMSESEQHSVANPSSSEVEPCKPDESGEDPEGPRASTSDSSCDSQRSGDFSDYMPESELQRIIETMDLPDNCDSENSRNRDQGDGAETNSVEVNATMPLLAATPLNSDNKDGNTNSLRRRENTTNSESSSLHETNRTTNSTDDISSEWTIKLKFINDDIKAVDGRFDEMLGEFKKRHFQQEEAANKVVKLIFNGQVLKQDNQSLQRCGLFDNCVVHCLVHSKRSMDNSSTTSTSGTSSGTELPNSEFFRGRLGGMSNFNNNNQGIDWDLGNFLFALISFILLAAWYFRYVYAHLYTVTATIGLIFITGIFTVVLVGMCFPDNYENVPIPTIRIARTERIEVQGQAGTSQSS